MKAFLRWGAPLLAVVWLTFSSGCVPVPTDFSVGGKVTGLAGDLGLSLNGTQTLLVSRSGVYRFTTRLPANTSYNVTISSQPASQNCSVLDGSGIVTSANITNVNVSCLLKEFHVGGTVSGLDGSITLQLNGGESITLDEQGEFQFLSTFANGESYNLTIASQPVGQQCMAADSAGNINVANAVVSINCTNSSQDLSPSLTHIWPGAVLHGREVKISGRNLQNASVIFNGVPMIPIQQTSSEFRFVAPENVGGIYALELENDAGATSRNVTQGEVMNNVATMEAGLNHSCAVLVSGAVQCWGGNESGQLGNGSRFGFQSSPATVHQINTAVLVSAGMDHSCAVLASGEVQCWGSNNYHKLGSSSASAYSTTPRTVTTITSALTVSAGGNHSCAVLDNGTVQCWGRNNHGQLGNGTIDDSLAPVTVTGINTAVTVSAALNHSCALLSNGTVQCWGDNRNGMLGSINDGAFYRTTPVTVTDISTAVALSASFQHSCAVLSSGAAKCWGSNTQGQRYGSDDIQNAVAISTGQNHNCALLGNGAVQCWGNNNSGELGNGSKVLNVSAPTNIANAVAVSTGDRFSCALLSDGTVQCWGESSLGRLGTRDTITSETPVTLSGFDSALDISVGGGIVSPKYSCAVMSGGAVQCWGAINEGNYAQYGVPLTLTTISGALAANVGTSSCALLQNGTVQCWGKNDYGQLGNGTTVDSTAPVVVSGIESALAISGSCALLSDESVQCWGYNGDGQLGNGTTIDSMTPVTVIGISNARAIASSGGHSCALLSGGAVQCWGYNSHGQLGNGTTAGSTTPTTVSGISNAVAISVNENVSCAALGTGEVRCWGSYTYAGYPAHTTTPRTVSGIHNAISVSAGPYSNCAILRTGAVQCWNDFDAPQTVAGIVDAQIVRVGINHSCALLSSGAVQCWGDNTYGQLSLPTTFQPGTPVNFH